MKNVFELIIHFIVTVIQPLKPGGVKTVVAHTLIMKQQLLVINCGKKRSSPLKLFDRIVFGMLAMLMNKIQLNNVSVIFKLATLIAFHKALVRSSYDEQVLMV